MDNIIEALINIENEAMLVTKAAEDEKNRLPQTIQAEVKKITLKIEAETKETIEALHRDADTRHDEKLLEIDKINKIRMASLQKDFDALHTQWETDIFNKILGR